MPGVCYYSPNMTSIADMTHSLMRRFAWIALFAVLLNAIAPTLSYVMAAGKGMAVVEVCTSFGLKKVLVSQNDSGDTSAAHGIKHCPFCLSADPTPPAPAKHAAVAFVPAEKSIAVATALPAIHNPLLSWSAAHKRGPPALA